jgi:acetoin utilization deacetylase AcuC-like enzyme
MEIAMRDDHGAEDADPKTAVAGPVALQEGTEATVVFSSELCERHAPPAHPESAERVCGVLTRLRDEFPGVRHVESSPPATTKQLRLFHTQRHVDAMFSAFAQVREGHKGGVEPETVVIDEDTVVTAGTEVAALAAVGAVCHAIDTVMQSKSAEEEETGGEKETEKYQAPVANAFCCVRPPGHHAEPDRAMGFCFFNNVGIGALDLLETYPDVVSRVLIVDFDVHHGNGTQAKFISSRHPNVKYISTHQSPFFPKTGKRHERGASGNILNVPLVEGTGSTAFRRLFIARVVPAMEQFKPDFVLISAGFDAHEDDPLANICLQHEDFYWMTKHILDVAWKFARGRVVSVLEGGASHASEVL